MKKLKNKILNPYLLIGFFIFTLMVLGNTKPVRPLKTTVDAKNQRQETGSSRVSDIKTFNRTKSFVVDAIEIKGDTVGVRFKNNYDKPVTCYQVAIGERTLQTELMVNDDPKVIIPGDFTYERYPAEILSGNNITVLAVLFDNHSGDGDPTYLIKLLKYREGMKIQRQYTISAIERVLQKEKGEKSIELSEIFSDLNPLSEEELQKLPLDVRFGIKDEQKRLAHTFQHFSQNNILIEQQGKLSSKREELETLLSNYRNTIAKL
jgi:hypothetical protein